MRFVPPYHSILSMRAKAVLKHELNSPQIQHILKGMFTIAYGEQSNKTRPVMVGLAAPQVGIMKRIILVDTLADGKGRAGELEAFINPKIIWRSKNSEEWYEGCYSTANICGIVQRAKRIKLKALDQHGVEINQIHTGYTARVFQHEIDHLNGIRFPERITEESNLHIVKPEEFPLYRDKQAWRNWEKKCTRDMWERIKRRN